MGATIDHFVSAAEAGRILSELPAGSLAAFDEAAWFGVDIVEAWIEAERRGVDVVVSSLSEQQVAILKERSYPVTRLTVPCMLCGKDRGRHSHELFHTAERGFVVVCDACREAVARNQCRSEPSSLDGELCEELTSELRRMKPFPGKEHAYQPVFGLDLPGWELVRGDTPIRADLIREVLEAAFPAWSASSRAGEADGRPSFIDLGCCTGFFCEYFAARGWEAWGLDIDEDFIALARRVSQALGSGVEYCQSALLPHVQGHPGARFDVTTSFATVQWVIAQSGLDAGLECFDWIFGAARKMCVLEMGYSEEEIYREKLPVRIDREWVEELMRTRGGFDEVLVIPKGSRGVWRDLFIGLKDPEVCGVTVSGEGAAEPGRPAPVWNAAGILGLAARAVRNPGRVVQLGGKAVQDPARAMRELGRRLRGG
jgi:SAM-dependent methyltransferase